jgi:predicted ribosomally synthesized peptide with SipW-like signal peptide
VPNLAIGFSRRARFYDIRPIAQFALGPTDKWLKRRTIAASPIDTKAAHLRKGAVNGMSTRSKLLVTLGVVAIMGLGVFGTFAAFTATSTNSGNKIDSGTVKVDDDSGTTTKLYDVSDQKPGDATAACIRIKYNGSLAASVKLYLAGTVTNGTNYNLKVERGSGLTTVDGTRSCAGFSSTSTAYDGDLGSFATTYAGGYPGKAGGAAWAQNDTVDYKFTITQNDDATVNAHTTAKSSGAHDFTWEARNN